MIKVYATIEEKNNVILTIPYKKMKIKATFENGNVFKGIPAKLYTNDPFVQKALDESPMCGKLYKLAQTIKEQKDNDTTDGQKDGKTTDGITNVVPEEGKTTSGKTGKQKRDAELTNEPPKLDFADAAEAIAYIAGNYQVQVTNESDARKFLKEKGVTAVIHKSKE